MTDRMPDRFYAMTFLEAYYEAYPNRDAWAAIHWFRPKTLPSGVVKGFLNSD